MNQLEETVPQQSGAVPSDHETLTNRKILRFFVPLAFSWIFMALEGPITNGFISRLPDANVNTAAFFLMMSLSLWIESPAIDLLSTSTTLAKNKQHYSVLTRFVWLIAFFVTAVHAGCTLTPLYGWLTEGILKIDPVVAASARPGLIIMIPWSALIAWRRYKQGIMIRFGATRSVGIGTLARVSMSFLSASCLYFFTHVSSIILAATSLMCSVGVEAVFAHFISRRVIRDRLPKTSEDVPLTLGKLFQFHLPLTLTTMVMFMGNLIVSRALARSLEGTSSMAAWQVALTLLFLMRTVVFALPEVVISLSKAYRDRQVLLKFCVATGLGTSILLALAALLGLDVLFFARVIQAKAPIVVLAHLAFVIGIATPFLGAIQSYFRGMLTSRHKTSARLWAIFVNVIVLVIGLELGLNAGWKGVINASVAVTLSMLFELGVLAYAWRRCRQGIDSEALSSA